MNRCWRHILIGLFAACVGGLPAGHAAPAWFARVWQSDDGLPDNSVTGVTQTVDGFLWVATQGGIVRFDGVQFERISLPISPASPTRMIRAMTVTGGDHLWLALEGGFVVSASPQGSVVYTVTNGLSLYRPVSMAQDSEGAVWVGYSDGTACRIEHGKIKHFAGDEGLPATGMCWLASDAGKHLWFAENNRLGVLRDGQFVPQLDLPDGSPCLTGKRGGGLWICVGRELFSYTNDGALIKLADLAPKGGSVEPLALCEDRNGAVWVGTAANGLFRFDGTNLVQVETSRGEVRSVSEDREGNIWVGTSGGGLNRLRPRALQLVGVAQGLPFETVRSVCEDAAGSLWVVTQNGLVARNSGEHWSVINTNSHSPLASAACIACDTSGTVWVGTTGNGLARCSGDTITTYGKTNGLASDRVWDLMADSQSNLWISLNRPNVIQRLRGGQFEKFELPAGSLVIRAMAEAADHSIWLGSEDGKLFRIQGQSLTDETQRTLPRPVAIRCLSATPDGGLWIGYGGAGVGWLKRDQFWSIGTEMGLPDDFISQIVSDGHGSLWFAGNRGIFEAPQGELEHAAEGNLDRVRALQFGKNEGLPSLQANFGYGQAAIRRQDGRMCFSMLTGVATVDPARIRENTLPPPVRIESVSVDEQPVNFPGENRLLATLLGATNTPSDAPLEMLPQQREIKIDFNALSFSAPENVRLRYQVEGYDADWIETSRRSATYSKMPAGDYTFRVIGCNNSGVWNPVPATLSFVVRPVFWQTWSFRIGAVIFFTLGMIALVRYVSFQRLRRRLSHLEQEAAVQKDRARIAKDLHDELGAHLSHIAMLSELAQTDLAKPPQVQGHLDQIFRNAQLVTRSLDEIVWAVNPRNDTLDRFVAHICQFVPEFLRAAGIRSRLDVPMDIPSMTLEARVRHHLYLGLKEALNNIVKHAQATEVWVRLTLTNETITLIVEDNGKGFDAEDRRDGDEDGLANLRQRMQEIGGQFEHHSEPGKGARLVFTAPLPGKIK